MNEQMTLFSSPRVPSAKVPRAPKPVKPQTTGAVPGPDHVFLPDGFGAPVCSCRRPVVDRADDDGAGYLTCVRCGRQVGGRR